MPEIIDQAHETPVSSAVPVVPAAPEAPKSKMDLIVAKYWKPLAGLIIIVLVVLGGLKAYSYFTSDPAKIWQDTSKKMQNIHSAHFNFDASYSEIIPKDDINDSGLESFLGSTGELKFSVSGNGVMALKTDKLDVDYDMNSSLSAKLGSLNISLDFLSRKVDHNVYYKVDGNFLGELIGGGSSDSKPSQWTKIDLNDSTYKDLELVDIQKNQIIDAFKKAKLMSPTKLLGSETISGVNTWHYQAALNQQELKNYIDELQKIVGSQNQDYKDVQSIVDKIQFRQLELWIGKSDHLIHQAVIETNAPSIMNASLDSARNKSRDARRLADARQLMTALELFYNDNGRYPVSTNGQPLTTDGASYKFSTYISTYPQAPTPADGSCTDTDNKYIYQQLDGGTNYKLDFCLGHDAGGFKAGIQEASASGLQTITPSNAGPDNDLINQIPFTGTIKVKLNLSDFDSKVNIEAPESAVDQGANSRNARRIADARQIQTALELYYNDNNGYPSTLNNLSPQYMRTLPEAPTPADGNCTDSNNKYSYQQLNSGSNYALTLCISQDTGGFRAGVLRASASGMENQ